jgi:acetyl esterase/lipase
MAAQGVVGVTLDHRLHGLGDWERAAQDVVAAVELARSDPRVDGNRVALWILSAGGLLSADWLAAPPPWLRCLAFCYPVLAPMPNWGMPEGRFRPAAAVAQAGTLPLVLVRAGRENPEIAVTVEEFLARAKEHGISPEVIDVPNGHHSFETVDPTEETRDALRSATRAVLSRLMA